MECRECCNNIQPFLKNKLDYDKTSEILKHVDECDYCKEQLRNGFLVLEGLKRLENGSDFNLVKDFEIMMEQSENENNKIHHSRLFVQIIFGILVLMVVGILVFGLLK